MTASTITTLSDFAAEKSNFENLTAYYDFAQRFLDFQNAGSGIQAEIVAKRENQYIFLQYDKDANYQVTRPLNSELMADVITFPYAFQRLLDALHCVAEHEAPDEDYGADIIRAIYTMQQTIGAALDGLPVGRSNQARKVNGDLFERLMNLLVLQSGIECHSGVVSVPVPISSSGEPFNMQYQHDMMIEVHGELRMIGSVKTSSKDRVDKIFLDKFMYSRLTNTTIPHVAIFLHDVQRTGKEPNFGVGSTFLPGHFKAYTLELNPLDGVFYCDLRPVMQTDDILSQNIATVDKFFLEVLPSLY